MRRRYYYALLSIILILIAVVSVFALSNIISTPKPEPETERERPISLEEQLRMKNFTVIAGTLSEGKNNIYTTDLNWFVQEAKNHNITTLFHYDRLVTQYVYFESDNTRYRLHVGW